MSTGITCSNSADGARQAHHGRAGRHRTARAAVGAVGLLLLSMTPAGGHTGGAAAVRPVVTGVQPAEPGVTATTVFSGEWQVRVTNVSAHELTVLDTTGRPYLRIGPGGVNADYGAPAWYRSSTTGAERLPVGVGERSGPDWRLVSVAPEWSWFDPSIRAEPGLITDGVVHVGLRSRLRDWEIGVRVGDAPGRVTGYLEYAPAFGSFRHRITSPTAPVAGVTVGLLAGQAIPVITLENAGSEPVIVMGGGGEPFARIGGRGGMVGRVVVEVNLRSPAWLDMARYLQRVPTQPADAAAEPQWQVMAEGFRWSWPEIRGRPPDDEPAAAVIEGGRPVTVGRWSVPLRVGDRPVEILGLTEFVPAAGLHGGRDWSEPAAVAALVSVAVAVVVTRRRRRPEDQSSNGQASLVKRVM